MIDFKGILLQWFIKFLIKKTSDVAIQKEIMLKKKLLEELHKPITREFKKRKVNPSFGDNISSADLADMQLISKFNKGIHFLLSVIDIFSKYTRVIPFKDKKCITITNAFKFFFR